MALHVLTFVGLVRFYVDYTSKNIYLEGLTPEQLACTEAASEVPTYLIREPKSFNEMGEADGQGKASNASPGGEAMRARQAEEDQSWLSRDAQGKGSPQSLPSPSIMPPGQNGEGGTGRPLSEEATPFGARPPQAPEETAPAPKRPPPENPKAEEIVRKDVGNDPPPPPKQPDETPTPVAEAPTTQPITKAPEPKAPAVMLAQAPTPVQAPSDSGRAPGAPGAPVPSADPAPQSDSESDPFSSLGSVDFRPGRVLVRAGRKVKTVRPRLTEAGKWDLAASMETPYLMFKVKIDETGKVTSVDLMKSSGSNNIDLPVRRAIYEWWIEPPKDKDGKPTADVMTWTISYR